MDVKRIIPMRYDMMFKSVLLNDEARDYLIELIHLITGINKEDLSNFTFKNTEYKKDGISERKKESDIVIEIKNNTICLEMNKDYRPGLYDRNFSYLSKIRENDIFSSGYKDSKYSILINFDNFNKFNDDRSIIKFKMLDEERLIEEGVKYSSYHIILPNINKKYYNNYRLNDLESLIEIMNLNKIEDVKNYLNNNTNIRKVALLIMELSSDEILQGWYDKEKEREKLEALYREELREEAIREGKEEVIKETAIKMKENNIDINLISKISGLSIEEINNL